MEWVQRERRQKYRVHTERAGYSMAAKSLARLVQTHWEQCEGLELQVKSTRLVGWDPRGLSYKHCGLQSAPAKNIQSSHSWILTVSHKEQYLLILTMPLPPTLPRASLHHLVSAAMLGSISRTLH